MSLDATIWAWKQKVGDSSAKLVLLSLADRAGADFKAFPSVASLAADTDLNRKTVISALSRLKKQGIIEDTGERKGTSGRVVVYRMIGVPDRTQQSQNGDSPKKGTIKRRAGNSPKNGTVPNLPDDSPKTGTTNSPNIGTRNQSLEPPIEPVDAGASNTGVETAPESVQPDQQPPDLKPNLFDRATQEDIQGASIPRVSGRNRFAMHWEWSPGSQFAERCRSMGIPLGSFDPEQSEQILGEFRSYWESRPEVQSQSGWEHKLAQRLKHVAVDRQSAACIAQGNAQNRSQMRSAVTAELMNVQNVDW